MSGRVVNVAVEGTSDAAVAERLLASYGVSVAAVYGQRGKHHLDAQLLAYNQGARYARWVVFRDLDMDASCGAELRAQLLPNPARYMCFRVAVRAIEAWLIADAEGCQSYFQVKPQHVPAMPDALSNPKSALVALAGKSRSRSIREDMVPVLGTTATVGPAYVTRIAEFAATKWSPSRASRRSDSLRRCIRRIKEL